MEFNGRYNYRYQSLPEVNSGTDITERAGYIPAKMRIEQMILAGQRLRSYRAEQFDFPDGKIDESFSDPTRSGNFDLADGTMLEAQLQARIEAKKAELEALEASSQVPQGEVKTDPEA